MTDKCLYEQPYTVPRVRQKQWALELLEKFNLPTLILDAKEYRDAQAQGAPNPFDSDPVVITSMHFASLRAAGIRTVQWDLAVIDEAHKLRNAIQQHGATHPMGA
jgi:SNF2 family DNA or RNA helicase